MRLQFDSSDCGGTFAHPPLHCNSRVRETIEDFHNYPISEYSANVYNLAAHPHVGGGAFHIDIGALHAQPHQLGHIRIVGGSRIRFDRVPATSRLTECSNFR